MYILKGVRKGTKKGKWVKIGVNIHQRERTKQGKEKRRSDYYGK